ncbi:MAG TPA: class I SAM-dependent methyltransferase [Povalibacter sp.]|uniref:class I SAM-dependent methyltransferase n=1 Tax=Povalibacter sp. TaxID=1962978 RepID=UPI002CBCC8D1|nr:class I SAM-dependent methyltransferase [Povalibacter sp.]HMN45103.1 class I SAM-dependent methyltransferase [Povalibacter sp.]
MDAAQRIERERDFHNQRFVDNNASRESRTRRFYDAIAYGFEEFRQRVTAASRGRSVLEYGCGAEIMAFDLAHVARQVTGIDISDVAIVQAQRIADQRALPNVKFSVDNAEDMRLADDSVDVVIGAGIVHHLDIEKSMQELHRVLRDGGTAIFAEPLGHNPVLNWVRDRTPEMRTPDEHPLLARDLRAMSRGFASSKVVYFGLVSPLLGLITSNVRPDRWLTRAVWSIDRLICRIPGLRRFAWYCYIELRA